MDLEKQALEILRTFEGGEPYQLGYSGGKDSDVVFHLAKKSGVKFQAVHNHTTVDAPETVRYVRSKRGVVVLYPPMSMWELIVKHKTPPTRRMRYCCEELKEYSGAGKKVITGVRKSESRNRRQNQGFVTLIKPDRTARKLTDDELFLSNDKGGIVVMNYDNSEVHRMVESCYRTSKTLVNPILEWDDEYLWWYIQKEQIEINPLYREGFQRIGCIGCPMAGKKRWREFARYPKYKDAYIRTFAKMLEYRKACGNKEVAGWKTPESVFQWWMEDQCMEGQISMIIEGNEITGFCEKG